jgi:hypothetical protein
MRARNVEAVASGAVKAKAAEDIAGSMELKVPPIHIAVVNTTTFHG